MTRSSRKKAKASSALKIGTAPWMIDARPESIRVSPQERSQKGTAVFTIPITTSHCHLRRISASVVRGPRRTSAIAASSRAAVPRRPRISVAGVSSRSAILISMNDAPQMSASSVRMTIGRRIYLVKRNAGGSREIPPRPRLH